MQPRVLSNVGFWKNMFILTMGGLRGAVGLVLAMIVARDKGLAAGVKSDPLYGLRVLTFVGGIVVLTTWLNALTLEPLIIWLGLAKISEAQNPEKSAWSVFVEVSMECLCTKSAWSVFELGHLRLRIPCIDGEALATVIPKILAQETRSDYVCFEVRRAP
jgi:NhaP-type Na+/H+ or K+/H+ antiporter